MTNNPIEVRRPGGLRTRHRRAVPLADRGQPREHRLPAHQAGATWATSCTASTTSCDPPTPDGRFGPRGAAARRAGRRGHRSHRPVREPAERPASFRLPKPLWTEVPWRNGFPQPKSTGGRGHRSPRSRPSPPIKQHDTVNPRRPDAQPPRRGTDESPSTPRFQPSRIHRYRLGSNTTSSLPSISERDTFVR